MKTCSTCKIISFDPEKDFNHDSTKRDDYHSQCKLCRKKLRKRYYRTLKGYLRIMYCSIITRCGSPSVAPYRNYGMRGISNRFCSFQHFFDYVTIELGFDNLDKLKGLTLDRENNDGDYKQGNLRFITHRENCNNRRKRVKV